MIIFIGVINLVHIFDINSIYIFNSIIKTLLEFLSIFINNFSWKLIYQNKVLLQCFLTSILHLCLRFLFI